MIRNTNRVPSPGRDTLPGIDHQDHHFPQLNTVDLDGAPPRPHNPPPAWHSHTPPLVSLFRKAESKLLNATTHLGGRSAAYPAVCCSFRARTPPSCPSNHFGTLDPATASLLRLPHVVGDTTSQTNPRVMALWRSQMARQPPSTGGRAAFESARQPTSFQATTRRALPLYHLWFVSLPTSRKTSSLVLITSNQ